MCSAPLEKSSVHQSIRLIHEEHSGCHNALDQSHTQAWRISDTPNSQAWDEKACVERGSGVACANVLRGFLSVY